MGKEIPQALALAGNPDPINRWMKPFSNAFTTPPRITFYYPHHNQWKPSTPPTTFPHPCPYPSQIMGLASKTPLPTHFDHTHQRIKLKVGNGPLPYLFSFDQEGGEH